MRFSSLRLFVAAALAFAALMASVGSAQATNSFSISPGGEITATSQGKLSFGSSLATIQCSFTLRGSLRGGGLFILSELLPMGSVNEVRISLPETCTGGSFLEVSGLPWTISFEKLKGERGELGNLIRLPIAKIIKILRINFKQELSGLQCRYEGNFSGEKLLTRESTNETARRRLDFITGLLRVDPTVTLRLLEGTFCPTTLFFAGKFSLIPPQKIIKRTP